MLPSDDLFKAALVAADDAADAAVSTIRLHDCFVWCAPVLPEGQRLQSIAAGLQSDSIKHNVLDAHRLIMLLLMTLPLLLHMYHTKP